MQANEVAQDFLVNMSASADVLAQAKVEVGLESIPEGKNVRSRHTPSYTQVDLTEACAGNYQMARQARLHPPPDKGRDRRSPQDRLEIPP